MADQRHNETSTAKECKVVKSKQRPLAIISTLFAAATLKLVRHHVAAFDSSYLMIPGAIAISANIIVKAMANTNMTLLMVFRFRSI